MKKSVLLLAVLIAFSASSCAAKQKEQEIVVPIFEMDEIKYNTEEAVVGDISQKYFVDGKFGYPYSQNVSFKINGTVDSLIVEENSDVSKGDLLCILKSDDLDRQLEEKKVYVDQAQKTVNTLISDGVGGTELELARTDLEILQMEYKHLEESLEDYMVYAPCDGVFRADRATAFSAGIDDQRGAENIVIPGSAVHAGQILGTIDDRSRQYIICDVYDVTLENVNFGTRVHIEQGANECMGKVVDIIEGDNAGMTLTTYIIMPDEDSGLSELDVKCQFDVYSKLDTVIVPQEAVKTTKDRTYVNLLIDGTKIEQDVETGIEDGDNIEILSGLAGGEQVIIN